MLDIQILEIIFQKPVKVSFKKSFRKSTKLQDPLENRINFAGGKLNSLRMKMLTKINVITSEVQINFSQNKFE